MPKKRNFLGGMQNYNPKNGEYEPNLTTASGEQATPENVPNKGENKSFKAFNKKDKDTSFENINAKRMGKEPTQKEQKIESEETIPENYDNWLNKTTQNKLKKEKERFETLAMSSKNTPIRRIDDNLISQVLKEGHSEEIVSKASNLIKKYETLVDNISNDLESLASQNNGVMVGLGFRLKTLPSLSRKINSEIIDMKKEGIDNPTVDDALNRMKDTARFTMVFDGDDFEKNVENTINKLKEKGYQLVRGKNTFTEGSGYKGLNCNFLDKNGNIFELQFHIPESIKVKEGIDVDLSNKKATIDKHSITAHDFYETTRLIEDKIKDGTIKHNEQELYNRLMQESKDRWATVRNYDLAFLK